MKKIIKRQVKCAGARLELKYSCAVDLYTGSRQARKAHAQAAWWGRKLKT